MLLHRHRALIWYAFGVVWFNSRGLKFDLFLHFYVVFFCAFCMQAMTHSVDNVPSQQAVKLVVVGPAFVEQCGFGLFLGDQWH